MAFESSVAQTTLGPDNVYRLRWRDTTGGAIPTFLARNFGISRASVCEFTSDWQVNSAGGLARLQFGVFRDAIGEGPMVVIELIGGSWTLGVGTVTSWAYYGSVIERSAAIAGLAVNTWFRMHVRASVNEDDTTTITATVRTLADVDIASVTATVNIARGDYCGMHSTFDQLGAASLAYVKGIRVQAGGATGYVPQNVATSYVYTFVNDLGEESAPSPASATVLRPDGVSVTVTTPTTTPVGTDPAYGITAKRIYRAVSGGSGTVFVFVGEIPLATTTFLDDLDDSEIADNEVLESEEWDLPPDDLQGILALPNAVMCGFRRNQLCFSVPGRPHAWRVRDRKTIDVDIVAIANIDATVVVGTKSHVYTAVGTESGRYTMSKPGAAQACTSKRGMTFVEGLGVVFPSPDGWQLCAGYAGQVRNITEGIFTKRQWEAYDPSSILAATHDGTLFWWSTGQTPDSGFALDMRPTGFGLIRLSFHAYAAHVDPQTDTLYLALSAINEPDDVALPVRPSFTLTGTRGIYAFDSSGSANLVFRWRGKLNLTPYPLAMRMAQIRALNLTNLIVRIYADGALIHQRVLASSKEFGLPILSQKPADSYELELIGTSTARNAQLVEDVMELT